MEMNHFILYVWIFQFVSVLGEFSLSPDFFVGSWKVERSLFGVSVKENAWFNITQYGELYRGIYFEETDDIQYSVEMYGYIFVAYYFYYYDFLVLNSTPSFCFLGKFYNL